MAKKISIILLTLTLIISIVSTTTSFIGGASAAASDYHPVKISETKKVRTNPQSFPADIAVAFVGLGGAFNLFTIPKTLNQFLAVIGVGSTLVSRDDTTTYNVTMHIYYLKKPTSTSAGYYKYKIKNNDTGEVQYTKAYNIGKNGA